MINDNNDDNSKLTPTPPLPNLNEMGDVPSIPKSDPHPPIIIPKNMEKDEELYEDVHDKRRRAVMREKLTGITILFFVGLIVLVIALVNGFSKSFVNARNQPPAPADVVMPVPAEKMVPTSIPADTTVNPDPATVDSPPVVDPTIPAAVNGTTPPVEPTTTGGGGPTGNDTPAPDSTDQLTFPSQVIHPEPNVPIDNSGSPSEPLEN